MAEFKKTNLGVTRMSAEDLHRIAIRDAGVVGSIGYGHAIRGDLPETRHGFGFAWVHTQGMGNCGTLILLARSDEAAESLRHGQVARLMRNYDLSYREAPTLYAIAKDIKYGLEDGVLSYAVATRDCEPAWQHFPGVGHGVWRWHEEWNMPTTDLSAPRLAAVAAIIEQWPHPSPSSAGHADRIARDIDAEPPAPEPGF